MNITAAFSLKACPSTPPFSSPFAWSGLFLCLMSALTTSVIHLQCLLVLSLHKVKVRVIEEKLVEVDEL